jgi:hypothetical protein
MPNLSDIKHKLSEDGFKSLRNWVSQRTGFYLIHGGDEEVKSLHFQGSSEFQNIRTDSGKKCRCIIVSQDSEKIAILPDGNSRNGFDRFEENGSKWLIFSGLDPSGWIFILKENENLFFSSTDNKEILECIEIALQIGFFTKEEIRGRLGESSRIKDIYELMKRQSKLDMIDELSASIKSFLDILQENVIGLNENMSISEDLIGGRNIDNFLIVNSFSESFSRLSKLYSFLDDDPCRIIAEIEMFKEKMQELISEDERVRDWLGENVLDFVSS